MRWQDWLHSGDEFQIAFKVNYISEDLLPVTVTSHFKIFDESQAEIIYCVDFSVGLEILEDMAEGGGPDVVLVCCGGGGLVSGIASAIKLSKHNSHCKIYGVEPHGCKCSYHLIFLS